MTDPTGVTVEATASTPATDDAIGAVARGGALNLVGAVVYGLANFALLVVLNRSLGTARAGIVLVAIALFSIAATFAQAGASTGLVRMISRARAMGRGQDVRATVVVAVVPVVVISALSAIVLWVAAPSLADALADGADTKVVSRVLRAMAPFLPLSALHTVAVQATRGFDTMRPQVLIERLGRALSLPLVVAAAAAAGMGPVGVGACWAATNLVALAFSSASLRHHVRRVEAASGTPSVAVHRPLVRSFWSFTAPRAVGQASEVAVNWLDTVLVGIIVSTTAAGIYASGTRYLLPGIFAAEALMQVTGPRISGLLTRGERAEASSLLKVVAGWQVSVMWPIYLVTALFPTPLLRLFGREVVDARGALIALSIAMLVTAPMGPVGSVILMSGRSRQSMTNTLVLVALNLGGNLIFVPRHGITAAGVVWGVTILVAAALPGWQAHRSLGVSTVGRPAFVAVALAAGTIGAVGAVARATVGDSTIGLALTCSVGTFAYLMGLRLLRAPLHLDALWSGIRRRS